MKEFISYFNSPFIRPKLKLYFGKVAIGTPYFFPRRAVKDPDKPGRLKYVNKKVGYDFVRLGWKTKWTNTDYRYEWSPIFSFVFFGLQLAITISVDYADHYWSSWLYYQNNTDKSKTKKERVKQLVKNFPQTWKVSSSGEEKTINYYDIILKKRFRVLSTDEQRDKKLKELGIK